MKQNLDGQRFNRLVVVQRLSNGKFQCKCDCGQFIEVNIGNLKSGHTKSCGCLRTEKRRRLRVDLTGQKLGRLSVQEYAGKSEDGVSLWRCQCDCGNETIVRVSNLRKGNTQS